jgi:hypothetical protein
MSRRRSRRRSLALAVAIAACVIGEPALAAPIGSIAAGDHPGDRRAIPAGKLAIGDSVMLGARTRLRARGFRVDASVSRQFDDGVRLVRSMASAGTLPRIVVVHLGNNGYLERADCDRLVRAAGDRRRVFLVSLKVPRGWRPANNQRLRACARSHDTTHLIGWYEASADHPGWFASDLYHLTDAGAAAYARLITRAV